MKINKYILILILLFFLKILGGLSCYFLYKYHYGLNNKSDIYNYYTGGKVLYSAKEEGVLKYLQIVTGINVKTSDFDKYYQNVEIWTKRHTYYGLFNENRTMIRLNALIMPISRGNIYVHIIFFAFLSFLGSCALYKAIINFYPQINKYFLIFAVFLIPSTILWSSAILKESIICFSLGFILLFLSKLKQKFNILYLIGFLISIMFLIISKMSIFPLLLPAILFLFISKKMNIKQQIITLVGMFCIGIIAFLLIDNFLLENRILEIIVGKQNDFINLVNIEEPNSKFELTKMEKTYSSFFSIIPEGLKNMFFRPFISDLKKPLNIFAFIENIFLLFLIIPTIIFFKKPDKNIFRLICFCFIFVILYYILIGIYTPNLGTLIRFRSTIHPFFVIILFCLLDFTRIKFLFLKLKKKIKIVKIVK